MQPPIITFTQIIDEYLIQLKALPEAGFSPKPFPDKWSKKEILGHLIDSAHNNIRRFIIAQYETNPMVAYQQDTWVSINNYQQQPTEDLIHLWYLLNKQMAAILNNTPVEKMQCTVKGDETYTIEWLATDYIRHLRHHVHQLLNLGQVEYP